MSDQTPAAPAEKKKKPAFFNAEGKFKPGEKMREAILEILSRKNAGINAEYKVVAGRHDVKVTSLKRMVYLYGKGKLEMSSVPVPVENKKLALATENERIFQNLTKYEAYLNDVFEDLLKKARAEFKEGNFLAFDQLGIPKVLSQLAKTRVVRNAVEKGNFAALESLMELQALRASRTEKPQAKTEISVTEQHLHIHPPADAPKTPAAAAGVVTGEQARMAEALKNAKLVKSGDTTPANASQ